MLGYFNGLIFADAHTLFPLAPSALAAASLARRQRRCVGLCGRARRHPLCQPPGGRALPALFQNRNGTCCLHGQPCRGRTPHRQNQPGLQSRGRCGGRRQGAAAGGADQSIQSLQAGAQHPAPGSRSPRGGYPSGQSDNSCRIGLQPPSRIASRRRGADAGHARHGALSGAARRQRQNGRRQAHRPFHQRPAGYTLPEPVAAPVQWPHRPGRGCLQRGAGRRAQAHGHTALCRNARLCAHGAGDLRNPAARLRRIRSNIDWVCPARKSQHHRPPQTANGDCGQPSGGCRNNGQSSRPHYAESASG